MASMMPLPKRWLPVRLRVHAAKDWRLPWLCSLVVWKPQLWLPVSYFLKNSSWWARMVNMYTAVFGVFEKRSF